jgi:putative transposase
MATREKNIHLASDGAWSSATYREQVIRRLAQSDRLAEADVRQAMAELSLSRAWIHNLVARYRSNSVTSALLPSPPGPTPGFSKLPAELHELIERKIDEFYASRQRPRIAALCRAIAHECHTLGFSTPSRTAIVARVSRRNKRTLAQSRQGAKATRDEFRAVSRSYQADYALQVVQIDHTPVDQIVVDESTRKPIGRPWLTLAIDIASRMVTGFYLTMEAPSAVSVAMTLRHAVLPKEEWLADRDITAPWPASGLPDLLHMDNAKEFHSRALARGCGEYGIEQKYRPPATPHYGGHIERLIGNMMSEIHLLPGTTFSNVVEKGDYDAQARSAMTLKELEHWLAIQIVGVYHARIHSAIQLPPNIAWHEALSRRAARPRDPLDPERFLLDFLPFEYRMVRRDGIRLFNIRYWNPVLTSWIGEGGKFAVKYDPRDLSEVFLQSPEGEHWTIPYADLSRPAISLWEHKQATLRLRNAGKAAVNESLLISAES